MCRTSLSTCASTVALNNTVCTSGLQCRIISLTSPSNPNSNNLSASSNINIYKFSIPTLLLFSSTSINRPGVATTISGLFRNATSCFCKEPAPITNAPYSFTYLFNLQNYSNICIANSRVGVTTNARMYPTGATLKYRCRIGSRNAAVLPEPVIELATTSFPETITGTANCWIAVGLE